ncbi:MAG: iron-containing alcohol dehydrogenase [Eubacteriales bacterium]|nr:iron-containing alcohol dehydrogenase [Eubacteriales bacterium]
MGWIYREPVEIIFGRGKKNQILSLISSTPRPFIIASKSALRNHELQHLIEDVLEEDRFTDISPNPDVTEVNACAAKMRERKSSLILAIGGGSVLDLSKAASLLVDDIGEYLGTGKTIPKKKVSVIAFPTTAGTGSEVTAVSVLTDRERGVKMPMLSPEFYPEKAIVDPELLYTLPKEVTASAGIDVLCHAIEGYWSRGRQPITSALAVSAIQTIMEYLPIAYREPENALAREKTAEASLIAGLAFNLPKTTASHACSFPLTNLYKIPHGEACGMTIDFFIKVNREHLAVKELVEVLGYPDAEAFRKAVISIKEQIGLQRGLKEFHLGEKEIEELVTLSHHPNINNNPVEITDDILCELFTELSTY